MIKKLKPSQELLFERVKELYTSKLHNNSILHINAVAGSGKTTMMDYIVKTLGITDFIYTAFNKAIVKSAVKTFGKERSCTYHAFAYKYISDVKIGSFYPSSIKEKITYNQKVEVVELLDNYFLSSYEYLDDYIDSMPLKPYIAVVDTAYVYLEKMANRAIPHTFNYMLKELHINLLTRDVVILLDVLFVDECQDMTPVILEIFALVDAELKLYFGDAEQSIYAFMDLISAFETAKEVYTMPDSFRLSPAIGYKVEAFTKKYIDNKFTLIGHNTSTKRDGSILTLTQNNVEVLDHVRRCQDASISYATTRDIKDIAEVPLKVEAIMDEGFVGKHSNRDPRFFTFINIMSNPKFRNKKEALIEVEIQQDVLSAYGLINMYRGTGKTIKDIVHKDNKNKPDKLNLISTVHSVKGLEADTVYISETLSKVTNSSIKNYRSELKRKVPNQDMLKDYKTQFRLMYVAMSRARFDIKYL